MASEAQLRRALKLAVMMLSPHEPPDSRAVSNEYVALATVDCEIDNERSWKVIDDAIARMREIDEHA